MTKEEFIGNYNDWDSHRVLLWHGLNATSGNVVEMGMGHGSTPQLHQYCLSNHRKLWSYDNHKEWVGNFKQMHSYGHEVIHVEDWDSVFEFHTKHSEMPDIVFIDHSPGERRKFDVELFAQKAKIVIVHDSEPKGWNASNYMVRPIFKQYKFVKDMESKSPTGAWTTALSNFIDVTAWQI